MRSLLRSLIEELAASGERSLRPRVRAVGVDLCLLLLALCFGVGSAAGMAVALCLALAMVLPLWAAALVVSATCLSIAALLILAFRARDTHAPARSWGDCPDRAQGEGPAPGEPPLRGGRRRDAEALLGGALEGSRLEPGELVMTSLIAGLLAGRDRSRGRRRE